MIYQKSLYIAITALMLFCTSCGDDLTTETTTTISPAAVTEIFTEEIKGHIIDGDNMAIDGAIISINGSQTTTDVNGFFKVNDLFLLDNGSLVTIKVDGYYTGYKLVYPPGAGTNFIKVQLIEKNLAATFNADEDFNAVLNLNASVRFEANSIQTTSGQIYEGEVNLFAHWYSPDDPALPLTMPGDLRGVNLDNQFVQLATYGMMAVELESPTGQALELAPGSSAILEFPLIAALRSNAPSVIPTWSYDENTGSWIEEGEATLEGNFYIAQVTHFSFWNCDAPFPIVQLTGRFQNQDNIPFVNHIVKIEVASTAARSGWTDGNGIFSGKVPQDEPLTIQLINECEEVIYDENLGSITEDTDLGVILVPNNSSSFLVTGRIVDCDSNPIPDGYVIFSGEAINTLDFFTEDGSFSKIVNTCNQTSFSVTGYDIQNLKASEAKVLDVSQSIPSGDLGDIFVCDIDIESFMRFEIEGEDDVLILNPSLERIENQYRLFGSTQTDSTDFSKTITIDLDNVDIGTQTPNGVNVEIFDAELFLFLRCHQICDVEVDITTSSNVVKGTFTGMLEKWETNEPGDLMITGSFLIPK